MRGSTALPVCAEGLLQSFVLSPQLSKASVITASGTRGAPNPEPAPNLLTGEAEGPSAGTCWSLYSPSPGC